MTPTLALILCIAFVLFLLRLERRTARDSSITLWIPTLWMLIVSSRPLGTWFIATNTASQGNDSGSPLDRWVLTALAAAALIVLVSRRIDWWSSLRRHKWLFALLAYMFLSTFWSEITAIALKRWGRELIIFLMALVIISECDPRQALASVLRRSAYILVPFSVVLIKYYPIIGRTYGRYSGIEMWTGVTGQKNLLGRLCMISAFFLLWSLYERWQERPRVRKGRSQAWADLSVILIALYLLVGSHSSTSLATLGLGTAIFFGLRLLRKIGIPRIAVPALVIFLMVFGVSIPFSGGSIVADYAPWLGRDSTLTGRTEIWSDVMPDAREQMLSGHGFGSYWTDARRARYEMPTAHNGYLDILLELGLVGLAFYAFWLLSCARQLHRALAEDYGWASLGICLLLMGLVYNFTESALNSFTEQMTVVPALMVLILSSPVKPRAAFAPYPPGGREGSLWTGDTWPEFRRNSART